VWVVDHAKKMNRGRRRVVGSAAWVVDHAKRRVGVEVKHACMMHVPAKRKSRDGGYRKGNGVVDHAKRRPGAEE